jgi:group II intron reverse transcriptase/maturase
MNIEAVQRRLWEQSQEHKRASATVGTLFREDPWKKRIRNLHDLMHNPDWLNVACRRVLARSRRKATGVDKETVHRFEQNREHKLECLRLELKLGTYRPQPVRRVTITKDNGKKRPLGIPCLRDKIVQEAMRMALEPIFEVEFHPSSYGFRPHRSAHHAVLRCRSYILTGFTWVIEGDVQACFDEIEHDSILRNLREKIMDNKFLALVGLFLKAGVSVEGVVQPTEKGVPQGGVLSPLLANIVLNRLDWFLHEKGDHTHRGQRTFRQGKPNIRFVRYADDWCVFITRGNKQYASTLRDQIRDFIKDTAGLTLSAEKTHITHVTDGFNFLGFRLLKGVGQRGQSVPKIKIGDKAKKNIRLSLSESLRHRPAQESISVRVERTSRQIRGWREYFRLGHDFSNIASKLDCLAFWATVKAICRKQDISTAKCMRKHYRKGRLVFGGGHMLERFQDAAMKRDYRGPKEYVPGGEVHFDEYDDEHVFSYRESTRQGSGDMRWEVMVRDSLCCRKCGTRVDDSTARIDHINPVKRFASFLQAHRLDNLQTLCKSCHQEKTNAERHSQR